MALRFAVAVSCAWQLGAAAGASTPPSGLSQECLDMISKSVGAEKADEIRKECSKAVGDGTSNAADPAAEADRSLANGLNSLAGLAKNLAGPAPRTLSEADGEKGGWKNTFMKALGGLQGAAFVMCEAAKWSDVAKSLDEASMREFTQCLKEHPAQKFAAIPPPPVQREAPTHSVAILAVAAITVAFTIGGMLAASRRTRSQYSLAESLRAEEFLSVAEGAA